MNKVFHQKYFYFSFSYRSFSFNEDGSGRQLISCDVNFCLVDETDCLDKVKTEKIICPTTTVYDWKKGPEVLPDA